MELRPALRLVLAAPLLLGCAGSLTTSVQELEPGITSGVIYVDNGDEKFDGDDRMLEGIEVQGYYRDGGFVGDQWYRATEDGARATSGTGGVFELDFRATSPSRAIGIQIDIPLPAEAHGVGTTMQVRAPLALEGFTHVAVPGPFEPCVSSTDECGQPQLPDLIPIVNLEQFDDGARAAVLEERALLAENRDADPGLLPIETWFVSEEDGRRRLRFASLTANIGSGPLHIVASNPTDAEVVPTRQRVWTNTWKYRDIDAGEFVFHEGHDHTHLDAFERYRLLDADGSVVAESAKVSFCLRDSLAVLDSGQPEVGLFTDIRSCGSIQQSINPGFGDHYNQFLPDQWIDITDVADGEYVVEITVDPLDSLLESDETNNQATFPVTITDP